MEREHRWLPRLAPHLPVPVSEPLAQGEPGEGYPYRWSVYRWLDGERASPQTLADPVRTAHDLAGFITALQNIDPAGGPAHSGATLAAACRWVTSATPSPPRPGCGDLATGNLLARDGRLSAVIDFGTLAVADPAVDLLPAWLLLPASAREAFREAVGTDDATWARGRGRALAGSLPVPDDPYFRDHPDRTAAAPDQLEHLIADHRQENV